MLEHVVEWLGAYVDGELNSARLVQVEKHLASCPLCQAELASLRQLSELVQASPLPDELPGAERFTAQLMLRLPRQPELPTRQLLSNVTWWLAPAAILGSWVFLQTVFLLSSLVWAAGEVGLLGSAAQFLTPAEPAAPLMTSVLQWMGLLPGTTSVQIAHFSENIGWTVLIQVGLQGILGALYIGWLVVWLSTRRRLKHSPPCLPAGNAAQI
jgi:predicted anti-sigma-YlaC factor YlaD